MTAIATPFQLKRIEATSSPVMLSIVIPAYNESGRIAETIHKVVEYLSLQPYCSELILVDDGSTDKTVETVIEVWKKLAAAAYGVEMRVLRNDRNRGKGFSTRHGMLIARGEWILFTDADLSSPIDQLDRLFAAAQHEGADIAIGSRRAPHADIAQQSLRRRLMSQLFARIVRTLGVPGYTDTQCGFKLYRRSAARTIASLQRTSRWSFDVEHLMLADRLGYQVVEVGIRWAHRSGSKVHPLSAGLGALCDMIRMRWIHRRVCRGNKPVEFIGTPSSVRIGDRIYQTHLSW
jgi:dolichyl-phosphate beta-glucosyltransferase